RALHPSPTRRSSDLGRDTARPERTVDLVRLAGQVAVELPGRVSALLDGRPAHLTFGAIHAGDAPNVIPSVADLHGSARTPELAVDRKSTRLNSSHVK